MKQRLVVLTIALVIILAAWFAYAAAYRAVSDSRKVLIQKTPDKLMASSSQMEASKKPEFETLDKSSDFYRISAKIPRESWDTKDEMRQFVYGLVQQREEDWKVGGAIYEEEKKIGKDFPDRPKMTYSMNIAYQKIVSEKKETVSYVLLIGEYTGGANGSETVQTFTFDKNGRIGLESFVNISGEQLLNGKLIPNDIVLSRLLLEKAAADTEHFPIKDMISNGLGLSYLKSDGVTLDLKKCNCNGFFYGSNLQQFAVTDEGMRFYFNKGAITAGAAGSVNILLDWESLKPFEPGAVADVPSLPRGYTFQDFTVAKTTNVECRLNSDCVTPGEYVMRSSCPYQSLCIQNTCVVVCPAWRK